jgi:hypothetical protein
VQERNGKSEWRDSDLKWFICSNIQCSHIASSARLVNDLKNTKLPKFSIYFPNITNGMFSNSKERKGKERKGKERKGKERKGKERKGKERKRK